MTRAKRYLQLASLLLMAGLACLAALRDVGGDVHAAVTLLYFQGQHNGDSVSLEWATATELSTAYFYVERADAQDGPYGMLDEIGIVPSEAPPDGLSGAEYQRQDQDNIVESQAYWYVLVEVESGDGAENRTEPIRVALADAEPTVTATPTSTRQPAVTPTATATRSSTITSTPTPLSSAGTATTSSTARTQSTRGTASVAADQTTGSAPIFDATGSDQGADTIQEQEIAGSISSGYPQPIVEAAVSAADSDQSAYPPPLPTPQDLATKSYPAAVGPRGLTNGTPIPNIGSGSESAADDQSGGAQAAGNSPLLGTLFLWIGFIAALLIFVSAVVGAIYYFSKQRAGNN